MNLVNVPAFGKGTRNVSPARLMTLVSLASAVSLLTPLTPVTSSTAMAGTPAPDSLTLAQVNALALEHHPSLKSAEAALRFANAGHRIAVAGYLPSITAIGTGTHSDGVFVLTPSVPIRAQEYNSYSAAFQATQLLYDFGRTTSRIGAASDLSKASAADADGTRDLVVMNAGVNYIAYLQSLRVVGVNEDAVAQAERRLQQAKAFYAVGRRPEFDVTKAEVDLANARVALIRARNQVQISRVQLENSIGVHFPRGIAPRDSFDIAPFEIPLDTLKTRALIHRPELRAARSRVSAGRELESSAWDQHLPSISATGTYSWNNYTFPLYRRWVAGVTVTMPIFQGFAIDAAVEQAEANTDAARAAYLTLVEAVALDVEQTYLSLVEARERMSATEKLVEQAAESYTLAQRQYAAGVATAIEVSDAELALANARITRIQSLSDFAANRIRLLRASALLRPQ
jgi:outer membrane protein